MSQLTREQGIYAAAAAAVLFIISLFFPWFGTDFGTLSVSVSGQDVVPSWWLLFIFAALAAAILVAEALNFELPPAIRSASWAAYLLSVCFIVTLMVFLDHGGRKFGVFLALIFSAAAAILATVHWRDEAR